MDLITLCKLSKDSAHSSIVEMPVCNHTDYFRRMEEHVLVTAEEQIFHDNVREIVISALLFLILYLSAFSVLTLFKKRQDKEDLYGGDDEDALVYRISVWCCTFTLATSFSAVLLLPSSVISNEILHIYPQSYYVQWLNSSLVQGLWNKVFLFSNLSLFVLLPFTYFFIESSGFSGSRKGVWSRVKETSVMLFLLGVLVLGLACVMSAILGHDPHSQKNLLDAWEYYLPFIYSKVSECGVVLLLFFTPYGFARLFDEVGKYVMKPQLTRNIDEELESVRFEEASLTRKLEAHLPSHGPKHLNGALDIHRRLEAVRKERSKLEKVRRMSAWRRALGYPLIMLLLLVLTALAIIMVGLNILELFFDRKALPAESNGSAVLGTTSLSTFGISGALIEVTIIFYILFASVAGFYSMAKMLRPKIGDTSMAKVVYNCAILLVFSSALPVLCRILGISNFDLLGDFGRQDWLADFTMIVVYNCLFFVTATGCLVTKFTYAVRQEIYNKIVSAFTEERMSQSFSDSKYFD